MSVLEMISIILVVAFWCFFIFHRFYDTYMRLSTATPDEYLDVIADHVESQGLALLTLYYMYMPLIMDDTPFGPYWKKFSVRNQELHVLPYEENDE